MWGTEFVQGGDLGACDSWWSASAPSVAGGMLNLCVKTENRNVEFLRNLARRSNSEFILEVRVVLTLPVSAPYPSTASIAQYQDGHAFLPLPQMTLVYKVKDFFDTSKTRSSVYRLFTTNALVGNTLGYPAITPDTIDRMFDVMPRNINTTKKMFTALVPDNVDELLVAPFNLRMATNWTNVDFAGEFSFMPYTPVMELLYQPEGWVPLAQHTYKFQCSLIGRSADRLDPTTTAEDDHVMALTAIAMPYGREVSFSAREKTDWTKEYTHLVLDCGTQLTFRRPSLSADVAVVIQAGIALHKTGQSGAFWLTGYGATPTPDPNPDPDPDPEPEPEPTPAGAVVSINSQLDAEHGVVTFNLVLNTTNLNGTADVVDHLKMHISSAYHFRVHNSKGVGPHSLPVAAEDKEPTFATVTTTMVSMGDLPITKTPHRLATLQFPLLLVLKGDEDKQPLIDQFAATAPTIRVVIPGFEVDETVTIETPTATKDYGQDDNNHDDDDKKKGGDALKLWLIILLMVLIVAVIVAVVVKFIIVPIRRRRQALLMGDLVVNSEYKSFYGDDEV